MPYVGAGDARVLAQPAHDGVLMMLQGGAMVRSRCPRPCHEERDYECETKDDVRMHEVDKVQLLRTCGRVRGRRELERHLMLPKSRAARRLEITWLATM